MVEHARSKADDLENKNSNLTTQLEEYKQMAEARKIAVDNVTKRLNDMKAESDLVKGKLDEAEIRGNKESKDIDILRGKMLQDEEVKTNLKLLQGT